MQPPYRGVAFLLSIGSLPIACNKDGEDSDTKASSPTGDSESGTSGTSGGSVSGTTTSGGPGPTTPTTGDSEGVSGTSSSTSGGPTTDASQGFITTASSSGATSEGDTEMLPPVTDPTCLAYGAHIVECFPRYEQYRQYIGYYCQYYKALGLRSDGQACADAFEAMYVCFSELPCEEFGNEETPPCEKQTSTVEQDCPSLPGPGDSESGDTVGETGVSSSTG
jgi:hypothetical protein